MNKFHMTANGEFTVECETGTKIVLSRSNGGFELTFDTVKAETPKAEPKPFAERNTVEFRCSGYDNKINCIKALREASKRGEPRLVDGSQNPNYSVMGLVEAKEMVEASYYGAKQLVCSSHAAALKLVADLKHFGQEARLL